MLFDYSVMRLVDDLVNLFNESSTIICLFFFDTGYFDKPQFTTKRLLGFGTKAFDGLLCYYSSDAYY